MRRTFGLLGLPTVFRMRFNRQLTQWGGARSSPAPAPTFRKSVNVLFPGTQEIEEIHAHVFAGFANAQEGQVLFNSCFRRGSGNHIAKPGKGFDRMFSVVVVPWNAIVFQKCKQFTPVSLEAFLSLQRRVT